MMTTSRQPHGPPSRTPDLPRPERDPAEDTPETPPTEPPPVPVEDPPKGPDPRGPFVV